MSSTQCDFSPQCKGGGLVSVIITLKFCTDGDFALAQNSQFTCIESVEPNTYVGVKEFHGNRIDCTAEARVFLKKLLCSFLISWTHYYLLKDLYEMFETLIDFLGSERNGTKTAYLCDRYEGTEIVVDIQ